MSTNTPSISEEITPVPLVDLKAQYRTIEAAVETAIQTTLERGDFVLGAGVAEFENEFAEFCETPFAVGVSSGTEALHVACRAAGIGAGDEVIVPAFTFIATALGIELAGATPVLVEVGEDALIDPDAIEAAITPNTKAIMPVHMFGQCADMDPINAIAEKHSLIVIEDAAQAHGARYKGRRAGSLGDFGCFSFYPGKNLGAYGDGGAVTTKTAENDAKLRSIRNLGSSEKYVHDEIGLNARLDTMQARILSAKLPHLDTWNSKRRTIASGYDEALQNSETFIVPPRYEDREHVYHLYVVHTANRDAVLDALHAEKIGAGIHYPKALHEHEALAHLGHAPGDFPIAEHIARTCLSLPIFAELDERSFERVVAAVTPSK